MMEDYLGLFQDGKLIAVLFLDESGLFETWYGEKNLEMNKIKKEVYNQFAREHPSDKKSRK